MDATLRIFLKQYAAVVAAAVMIVVTTAFVSIPLNLGRHPGEARAPGSAADWHAS